MRPIIVYAFFNFQNDRPMKKVLLSLLPLLSFCFANAQTNVRAWYADGQVWVVWQVELPLPQTYAVFAKQTAFTQYHRCTAVGPPIPLRVPARSAETASGHFGHLPHPRWAGRHLPVGAERGPFCGDATPKRGAVPRRRCRWRNCRDGWAEHHGRRRVRSSTTPLPTPWNATCKRPSPRLLPQVSPAKPI
jgi:hypothetical protein